MLPHPRDTFRGRLDLYERRSDKTYNLTDSISMQTMKFRRITQVVTADRELTQERFEVLIG